MTTAPVLGDGGEVVTVPLSEAIALAEARYGCGTSTRDQRAPASDEKAIRRREAKRDYYLRNRERFRVYSKRRYEKKKKVRS